MIQWMKRLFKRQGDVATPEEGVPVKDPAKEGKDEINRGVFYLYGIIGAQILLVLGLMVGIMVIGKVISTPLWIFLFTFIVGIAGFVYVYRKAKRQLKKFREALNNMDLSDRNFEISLMGGMLTMRVEQANRPLLEAPRRPAPPAIESEPIDATPSQTS